jgi:hypothetical protein
MIVVFYKKVWRKTISSHLNDVTRNEFLEWTNGVWTFSGESKKRVGHPAPFPVELPRRCIKLFSFVGDTVFDPFLGSGTTLIACLSTQRRGIGVDIDKQYCDLAKSRIEDFRHQPLHQVSQSCLANDSLQKVFGKKRALRPPSEKQIALVLAKTCELPYPGKTKTGKRVHAPSNEQVRWWIGRELSSKVDIPRNADRPTDTQVAIALAKILKMSVDEALGGDSSKVSADQIRLWVQRHTENNPDANHRRSA